YHNGQVKPNEAITRAEFATILQRAFHITASSEAVMFNDIEGHWASSSIQALAYKGILKGYADGAFKPDQPISKEEIVVIIARIIKLQAVSPKEQLVMLSDLDHAGA